MTALEKPNYTQVPNALFEHMAGMSDAELRCMLVLVRQIFGYHKDGPEPVSQSQIMKMSGLSKQGVVNGMKAAIEDGYVLSQGTGKGKANLYTLSIGGEPASSMRRRRQPHHQSSTLTSQEGDQSTPLTGSSQPGRPVLVNVVDTPNKDSKENSKEKEPLAPALQATPGAPAAIPPADQLVTKTPRTVRPREDGTDPIPAALMNPMKDALAAVFGWQWTGDHPMTDEEKGLIQKTARSLCRAKFPASDVPKLYAYCQGRFTDFGPGALSKHLSAYRKTGGPNGRSQNHVSLAARRPPAAQPGGNRAADAGRTEATPRGGHDPEWIAEQGRKSRERARARGYKVPDVPG